MTGEFVAPDVEAPPTRPSRTTFLAIFVLALLAIGAFAIWFGATTRQTEQLRGIVRASYLRRIAATDLMLDLTAAESSQRGYILTGNPSFLARYAPARTATLTAIARLNEDYPSDSPQRGQIDELHRVANAKFVEMASAIALRHQGLLPAAAQVSDEHGKHLMDRASAIVTMLIDAEDQGFSANITGARARNAVQLTLVQALAVLAAALLLIGLMLIWQSQQARYRLRLDTHDALTRLRAIFAGTIDAIVIFNPSGTIETMNSAATRMFGYTQDDFGRSDASWMLGIADGAGSFHERLGLRDGILQQQNWLDRSIRAKDGRPIPVDIALGLISLPGGIHVIAAIRDISERKASERLKDEFVANVSHELRTPLTSVVGSLGLLRGGSVGELPDAARRLVEIAENNSRRLIRLINDILDIEKIGSGRMHFENEPVELVNIVGRAIDGAQGLAEGKAVQLETALPGSPLVVRGDADRLLQVLANLLSNAIRFSPAEGKVRVSVVAESDTAVISVEDQGPGIPPEFERRIFERFAQASSGGTVPGGTGLGLAISREIIEAHDGRIWFDESGQSGAKLCFSLPLLQPTAADMAVPRNARILLCEDDADTAELIRAMLETEGCIVDRVATAREAEEAARSGRYEGIILDLKLPDANGLEAVRTLRRRPETQSVPIIVVSATASDGQADPAAAALDVIDWIDKPVDHERLIRAVNLAIRHAAASRPTLLHIDDDTDMLEVTATALADQGRMLRATSLATARAILARHSIDIVILDLNLTDGSGLDLLPELLAADGHAIPTIIYSAQDVLPDIGRQVDAVLVKSRRSLPSLASTIRRLLEQSRGTET